MSDTPWISAPRIPSHEEIQIIMRRAHAQRAQAMRDAFTALFAWRKPDAPRDAVAANLKTVPCT